MKSLPTAPRVAKLPSPPSTVEEWLGLLYLSEYLSIFVHHGYTTMDRVKQIWEVELTSVSKGLVASLSLIWIPVVCFTLYSVKDDSNELWILQRGS